MVEELLESIEESGEESEERRTKMEDGGKGLESGEHEKRE